MSSDFFEQVYQTTRKIPFGRVTSYGAIARYLGSAQSSRMVGWALNKSSSQKEFVPAHRVVNRNGLLSGKRHFDGIDTMQQLLESEGIIIKENCIIDFKKLFWDPNVELNKTH